MLEIKMQVSSGDRVINSHRGFSDRYYSFLPRCAESREKSLEASQANCCCALGPSGATDRVLVLLLPAGVSESLALEGRGALVGLSAVPPSPDLLRL